MDIATKNLSKYIKEKGIEVAAISKATGISYGKLDPSLKKAESGNLEPESF